MTEMEYYDSDVDPNDIMFLEEVDDDDDDTHSESSEDRPFRAGNPDEPRLPKPKPKPKAKTASSDVKQRSPPQVKTEIKAEKPVKVIMTKVKRKARDEEGDYGYKADGFVVEDEEKVAVPKVRLMNAKVMPVSLVKKPEPVAKPVAKKPSVFNRLKKSLNRRK
jgi:hypothetical protein